METGKEMVSERDHALIHEYIVLTTLTEVLSIDIEVLKKAPLKLQFGYVSALENVIGRSTKDLVKIKALLKKNGIKVFDRKRLDKDFTSWTYLCRGYEGETRRWAVALRNQTNEKLLSYLKK